MKCSFSILLVKNVLHQIIHLLKRQSNLGVSQQNIQKTQSRKDLSVMNLFWVESRVENYYAQIEISTTGCPPKKNWSLGFLPYVAFQSHIYSES